MRTPLLILIGLAGIGALTYLCAQHHRPMIESDLTARTSQSLLQANIGGARSEAEGQIITLRGDVPDEAAKRRAGDLAASVWGVSEVRNLLEVKSAAPVATMTPEEHKAAVNCQQVFRTLLEEPIRFGTGSAVIHPASYPLLNNLAGATKTCPAASIEVGGHTDSRGGAQMNMKLSERRAQAVVAYLARKGVDQKHLASVGYGPKKPVADNSTRQGMEKNRRIEFRVKGI